MRKRLLVALGLALACLAGRAAWADAPAARLAPAEVRPGGIAALQLPPAARLLRAAMAGRDLLVPASGAILIGVDLDSPPGVRQVELDLDVAGTVVHAALPLTVLPNGYPVQRLTLPRTYTELDPATLRRVAAEKAVVDALWEGRSPRRWHAPFRLPTEPPAALTGFGVRRIINGEPRAAHTGADVAASAGTPVLASNAGRVVLCADHFFAGNSVVLDHGEGLFTMYFHLREPAVAPGEVVGRGQVIGRVGSTGRASGPHLHWGVRLSGARVDPAELLRATQ